MVSSLRQRSDRRYRRLGELGRVKLAKLEADGPRAIASEVKDLADQVLHPFRVSLHGFEHGATLLGCRL